MIIRSALNPLASRSLFVLLAVAASCLAAAEPIDGPLPPERARESFQLEPGLRLELVAAEPLVVSPVAMAFDERGRLFVVENRGYPTGPGEGQPPVGRIVQLVDSNGDGQYDQRVEFAGGLTFPNGVLPWDGGLIVTCAPDILFLKDVDGDGTAEQRDVLLTGFSTSGSTQLRVSHPTLGPDGWIYVTSGLTGGKVTSPRHPERPAVEIRRTDLRFRPTTGEFEAADGGAQFGMSFDDAGHRFICYNRVQAQHVVTESRYWRRNPQLAFADTVHNCPDDLAPEPLRGHGQAARLYPLSSNVTTADSHAGTFTAACAVHVWRGSNLPDAYRGGVFSCDPTGNLVHFDSLAPQGATYAARRARDGMEFLASRDNWFRPVYLSTGPDGALYVCDMYRKTIEHPDYLPVEVRKHTDFESGKTMGRLWRVVKEDVPADALAPRLSIGLATAAPLQLVEALSHPNAWQRDTARRLLSQRSDESLVAPLQVLAADAKSPSPAAGLALRLLDARRQLDDDTLTAALRHESPGVREQAVSMVESRTTQNSAWVERLLTLADDPDARVRFQAALTLGGVADPRVAPALAQVAVRGAGDRWTRAAVMSGAAGRERALFRDIATATAREKSPPSAALWSEMGRLLGASTPPADWPATLELIYDATPGARDQQSETFVPLAASLAGFGESIRSRGAGGEQGVLLSVLTMDGDKHAALADRLRGTLRSALELAANADAPDEVRGQSLALLAHADFAAVGAGLLKLVDAQQSATVQSGAVRALGLMKDDQIAAVLLDPERFRGYTPRLREEVLAAVLSGPQHLPGLLAALESGAVPPNAIDSLRRRQLTEHRDPAIKARAAKVYASLTPGDRLQVYESLKSVVALTPDAANGRVVFKKTCAACHRLDREGTPVGPDLFGIRNQPKETILLHIVIPEQEITQGFAAYVVTTHEGRVLTGLLSAETPTSITLRQSLGKEETILRSDIEQIVASKLSLMPQELEKQIQPQEFADLLAYLKGEQ
ncbi:MAG: PVC-type heme-binding CxxCH protein [Pirellulales bacterium]